MIIATRKICHPENEKHRNKSQERGLKVMDKLEESKINSLEPDISGESDLNTPETSEKSCEFDIPKYLGHLILSESGKAMLTAICGYADGMDDICKGKALEWLYMAIDKHLQEIEKQNGKMLTYADKHIRGLSGDLVSRYYDKSLTLQDWVLYRCDNNAHILGLMMPSKVPNAKDYIYGNVAKILDVDISAVRKYTADEVTELQDTSGETATKKDISSRMWRFVTRTHDDDGKQFITQEIIDKALAHKQIKQWAYILHDKDTLRLPDDEKQVVMGDDGEPVSKPPHYHFIIRGQNAIKVSALSKWFGLPTNMFQTMQGRGTWEENLEYLTHEHKNQCEILQKHVYEDVEVKTSANLDFRTVMVELANMRLSGVFEDDSRDFYRLKVYNGEMTLRDCEARNPTNYVNDLEKLAKLRGAYLSDKAKQPATRINYYVQGSGGNGKDAFARALAYSLFPNLDDDRDIIFEVGGSGVEFQEYDGQPVVIWSDFRAIDMLQVMGRREFFRVFDPHPPRNKVNKKYGSSSLVNAVNIVTGVDDYNTFLLGLVGEFTDKKTGVTRRSEESEKRQSYRRFPLIINIRETDYDIYLNTGLFDGNFEQYKAYRHYQTSFRQVATKLDMQSNLGRGALQQIMKPVLYQHDVALSNQSAEYYVQETMTADDMADLQKMIQLANTQGVYCLDITYHNSHGEIISTNVASLSDAQYRFHDGSAFAVGEIPFAFDDGRTICVPNDAIRVGLGLSQDWQQGVTGLVGLSYGVNKSTGSVRWLYGQ